MSYKQPLNCECKGCSNSFLFFFTVEHIIKYTVTTWPIIWLLALSAAKHSFSSFSLLPDKPFLTYLHIEVIAKIKKNITQAIKIYALHLLSLLHSYLGPNAVLKPFKCLAQGHGDSSWQGNGEWFSFIRSAAFQWKPHNFHLWATTTPHIYLSAGCLQQHTQWGQHGHTPCVRARFGSVLMSAIRLIPPCCAHPAGQTHRTLRVCVFQRNGEGKKERVKEINIQPTEEKDNTETYFSR